MIPGDLLSGPARIKPCLYPAPQNVEIVLRYWPEAGKKFSPNTTGAMQDADLNFRPLASSVVHQWYFY
jgi:hypothetical protein